MKLSRHILVFLACSLFCITAAFSQPGFKVDIDKPKPYTERKLKSEKTGDGKLKAPKRIMQNLTTRFNYYFNANNKFNEILERAREQHKDDYSQLLSFYNYDLNTTAADSAQLDSVIYKSRTGIANHDLRNEWIDELYLLWASSWHLQKKFDSASMMLQFINYAYAPQDEDGYYKYIGTHNDGDKELSIATKEDKKFLHSNTFSRNNAFIWQIRTRIEMGDLTAAGNLITTLKHDPVFPKRLDNGLDEVEAYWQYKQEHWDSSAVHLLAALDGSYTKLEKARWTYLAAQMLERAGKPDEAAKLYEKVIAQTPDPVMDVYARLNVVRLSKEGGEAALDKNLAELLKMAKKDKYEEYRDIIYYMAAQMELNRGNIAAANELLLKGSKYNNGNQAFRNKAFLQIADVSYERKKYIQAASFYDSVQVSDLIEADASRVSERKAALQKVVLNSGIVYRQDSLQRIAAMPQADRDALIKSVVKKLRKEQGLKEDATVTGGATLPTTTPAADLFSSDQKGEWYFYNATSKAQGSAQFKSAWGNRPNVDNWRRFAAVNQQLQAQPDKLTDLQDPTKVSVAGATDLTAGNDLSFEGLSGKLPLTPEKMKTSNDSIRNALFSLGLAYLNQIEDYPAAINTFEELRRRFPDAGNMDEVLFNLYYAYSKSGHPSEAAQTKKLLTDKYPSSRFAAIALTGKDPQASTKNSPEATKAYENVYNLFIEGRFEEAETEKRIADSTYKTTSWQPQLLYIEAVYHIRQRDDSVAKKVLQTLIAQNSNKAMTAKAQNLLSVLSRRQQIEDELTRLQITRPSDNDTTTNKPPVAYQPPVIKDTAATKPVVNKPVDTLANKPVIKQPKDSVVVVKRTAKQISDSIALSKATAKRISDSLATAKRDSLALAKEQAAKAAKDSLALKTLLEKQKRDSIAQVKAAQEQARRDSIALRQAMLKQATDSAALRKYLAKRLTDSLARVTRDSLQVVKKQAAQALADSLARKLIADKKTKDSLALAKLNAKRISDSIAKRNALTSPEGYFFNPNEAHYAVVILDKVDPVFVNEAKNAFFRYNKEKYYGQPLDVQILNLSADVRLLIVSGLPTAAAATDYVTKTKPLAPTEIIPWLTGNKYTFTIISASNLEILKSKADMGAYKKFLEQHLPGKF